MTPNVGTYTGSASPNGTFDQGGSVWEWNETFDPGFGGVRGIRGGMFPQTAHVAERGAGRVGRVGWKCGRAGMSWGQCFRSAT